MDEVPCAGEQSLEGGIAVGDVGYRRVEVARRAWVVLDNIDETSEIRAGSFALRMGVLAIVTIAVCSSLRSAYMASGRGLFP